MASRVQVETNNSVGRIPQFCVLAALVITLSGGSAGAMEGSLNGVEKTHRNVAATGSAEDSQWNDDLLYFLLLMMQRMRCGTGASTDEVKAEVARLESCYRSNGLRDVQDKYVREFAGEIEKVESLIGRAPRSMDPGVLETLEKVLTEMRLELSGGEGRVGGPVAPAEGGR